MNKKLRDYCLHDPIYGAHIIVIINKDQDDAIKLFKQKYSEDIEIDTDMDGYTFMNPGKATCVWLKKFNNTVEDYVTLVHELHHATGFILNYNGVKFDTFNDEPFTYYLSFLVREFLTMFKKK